MLRRLDHPTSRQARSVNDITVQVCIGTPDDDSCPIRRCACGAHHPAWTVTVGGDPDAAEPMPCCGRRLVFTQVVTVYQVED